MKPTRRIMLFLVFLLPPLVGLGAGLAVGFAVAKKQEPKYSSSTAFQVQTQVNLEQSDTAAATRATIVELIGRSHEVTEIANAKLKVNAVGSPPKEISVTQQEGTPLLTIRATGPTSEVAQLRAIAFAEALVERVDALYPAPPAKQGSTPTPKPVVLNLLSSASPAESSGLPKSLIVAGVAAVGTLAGVGLSRILLWVKQWRQNK